MSDKPNTRQIIEALLLAAGKPVPLSELAEILGDSETPASLQAALEEIQADCAHRGFELKKVASGYRFQVRLECGEWVAKLWEEKPQRFSRALLETLAIIAYRQPVTRGEIEKIRGVAVGSSIVRTLLDQEWVRVVGRRDVPGRPALFATTRSFLDYFNLESLEQLPPLAELRDLGDPDPELFLAEEAPQSRVLELPPEEDQEDEELTGESDKEEEILALDEAEENASVVGARSLDEILGQDLPPLGNPPEKEDEAEAAQD